MSQRGQRFFESNCALYHVVGLLPSIDHEGWPFKFIVVKQTHSLYFRDHANYCLGLLEHKIPIASA